MARPERYLQGERSWVRGRLVVIIEMSSILAEHHWTHVRHADRDPRAWPIAEMSVQAQSVDDLLAMMAGPHLYARQPCFPILNCGIGAFLRNLVKVCIE